MAAGLSIATASSAAWAEMGAQAERALNTGWIFDQRQDGAGGFVTNASPTSSGLTFTSTGDATLFYTIGRAVRVLQAAQTAICTVGQSSFAGGITTVYLNQFSTQTGLSTALSTGAVTSAAASPITVGTTGGNQFSGSFAVVPTTGGAPGLALGQSPATQGAFRVGNLQYFYSRDAAGAANIQLIGLSTADKVLIAASGNVTNHQGPIEADGVLGAATVGSVRFPNSAFALVGKTSTGGNDVVWPVQFMSTSLASDIPATVGVGNTQLFSKSLAVGTWKLEGAATVNTTGVATYAYLRIHDGVTTYASAFVGSVGGSTASGASMAISAVVSHSTALAYVLDMSAGTTNLKALVSTPGILALGPATFFNGVKIG